MIFFLIVAAAVSKRCYILVFVPFFPVAAAVNKRCDILVCVPFFPVAAAVNNRCHTLVCVPFFPSKEQLTSMIRQLSRLTAKTRRLGREPSSVWSPRDSVRPTFCGTLLQRSFSDQQKKANDGEHWSEKKVAGYVGHNFPDFIEHWNREAFRRVGYGLGASTVAVVSAAAVYPGMMVPAALTGALTAAYWHIGLRDMKQTAHAIRRNYPVLGNARYIVETVSTVVEFADPFRTTHLVIPPPKMACSSNLLLCLFRFDLKFGNT